MDNLLVNVSYICDSENEEEKVEFNKGRYFCKKSFSLFPNSEAGLISIIDILKCSQPIKFKKIWNLLLVLACK
jgi:hypothetical protein